MKKILSLTLTALLLAALLAGCGGAGGGAAEEKGITGSWAADVDMTEYLNEMLSEDEEIGQFLTLDNFTIKLLAEFKEDGTYTMAGDPESAQAAEENIEGFCNNLSRCHAGIHEINILCQRSEEQRLCNSAGDCCAMDTEDPEQTCEQSDADKAERCLDDCAKRCLKNLVNQFIEFHACEAEECEADSAQNDDCKTCRDQGRECLADIGRYRIGHMDLELSDFGELAVKKNCEDRDDHGIEHTHGTGDILTETCCDDAISSHDRECCRTHAYVRDQAEETAEQRIHIIAFGKAVCHVEGKQQGDEIQTAVVDARPHGVPADEEFKTGNCRKTGFR